MKRALWIPITVMSLLASACGPDKPAGRSDTSSPRQSLTDSASPSSDLTLARPLQQDIPAPPANAQFTLYCASFQGEGHIIDANRVKNDLIRQTHLKNWYVLHSEESSDLYFGFYTTFDDPRQPDEVRRAHDDRETLEAMTDSQGAKLFTSVVFVPVTSPDPVAPKEWDLASCKGYWTLQVAVYKDSPLRKQYAVDAVREFRARGTEAYFHHDAGSSQVFVGSWPKEAVNIDPGKPADNDPHKRLLVLSHPIAGAEDGTFIDRRTGEQMQVVQPKMEIIDPDLKAAIAKYPYTELNGTVMGREVQMPDHTKKVIPDPSFLIQVRDDTQGDQAAVDDATDPNGKSSLPDALQQDQQDSGMGRLKTIGQ